MCILAVDTAGWRACRSPNSLLLLLLLLLILPAVPACTPLLFLLSLLHCSLHCLLQRRRILGSLCCSVTVPALDSWQVLTEFHKGFKAGDAAHEAPLGASCLACLHTG
jgi:hypothetical protein